MILIVKVTSLLVYFNLILISYLTVIYTLKYLAYTTLKSSTTVTTFTHMGVYVVSEPFAAFITCS